MSIERLSYSNETSRELDKIENDLEDANDVREELQS